MLKKIIATDDDRVIALIRIAIGSSVFSHGAQKELGWWGGGGIDGTYAFMTGQLHIPGVLAYMVIFGEFFAALGLITGTLGRIAAAGNIMIQTGALLLVHIHIGWKMEEYSLLALSMCVAILIRGSGAWSIDRLLMRD